jgi:hypothetical protein
LPPSEARRVALDKSEGVVKDTRMQSGVGASQRVPEKVEDQDSGNLTLNHSAVDLSFHQPSIRPNQQP